MDKKRENLRRMMISVNIIYQAYSYMAKKMGIKDEMLSLLYALEDGKMYTQADICKMWNIPKTTINTIVLEGKNKNLITLVENPLNKKEKYIKITEYGKLFSEEILKSVYKIEDLAYQDSNITLEDVIKLEDFSKDLEIKTKEHFNQIIKPENKLEMIQYAFDNKYIKEIEKLYKEAFPANERIGFKYFINNIPNLELYIFVYQNHFVGFALTTTCDDIVYLLYFAMTSKHRSKGFGSQALELLKKRKKGKTILADIEVGTIDSINCLERIKRKKFYLRAGFFETNVRYTQRNVEFEILCFGEAVTEEDINEVWKILPNELVNEYRK